MAPLCILGEGTLPFVHVSYVAYEKTTCDYKKLRKVYLNTSISWSESIITSQNYIKNKDQHDDIPMRMVIIIREREKKNNINNATAAENDNNNNDEKKVITITIILIIIRTLQLSSL